MAGAADGDRSAIDPLFHALWPIVLGYSTRFLGDSALAEDAAQEALVRLFGQIDRYDRTHLVAAAQALAIAGALVALAIGLHRTSNATWLIAGTLGVSLAVLAWRGGPWRRGAFAGVIAGLPPLIAPSIVFALNHGAH